MNHQVDLIHSKALFRGDWINIRRTIAFYQYCRPRSFFPWIYIPVSVWDKIASHKNYIDVQNIFSQKGIIKYTNPRYIPGKYSKSYRIALPGSFRHPIKNDNRAETDISNILLRTFGTVRNAVEATGMNRWTAERVFNHS